MKSFVIGLLVLTSVFLVSFGKKNELSSQQKCEEIKQATVVRFDTCMAHADNIKDVLNQLNNTIYNDLTEASLENSTARVCRLFQKAIDCESNGLNFVATECKNTQYFYKLQIQLNLMQEGTNFFCKNNAQNAKDIAENEGYQFVLFSDHIKPCYSMMNKESMFIEKPDEIKLNPNFCISLDETKKCVENASNRCKNKKVKTMAGKLFSNLKAVIPCGTH